FTKTCTSPSVSPWPSTKARTGTVPFLRLARGADGSTERSSAVGRPPTTLARLTWALSSRAPVKGQAPKIRNSRLRSTSVRSRSSTMSAPSGNLNPRVANLGNTIHHSSSDSYHLTSNASYDLEGARRRSQGLDTVQDFADYGFPTAELLHQRLEIVTGLEHVIQLARSI